MAKADMMTKIGSWAFLIGIVIALIVGLYQAWTLEDGNNFFGTDAGGWVAWLLAIIGAIVGIVAVLGKGTITKKEVPGFLMTDSFDKEWASETIETATKIFDLVWLAVISRFPGCAELIAQEGLLLEYPIVTAALETFSAIEQQ